MFIFPPSLPGCPAQCKEEKQNNEPRWRVSPEQLRKDVGRRLAEWLTFSVSGRDFINIRGV
jgi:hypothetical protein